MDTTQTLWSVDGESLQTYAWNITTLGGTRDGVPELRGENIEIPFSSGTRFVPKVPDARVITLAMWVQGSNTDGTIPRSEDAKQTYVQNLRKLKRLLWTPGREVTLTKKMWVLTDELWRAGVDVSKLPSQGRFSLYTVSAKAQYAGGLDPENTGSARATFTVDLMLADPFFYAPPVTYRMTSANQTITVAGDYQTNRVSIIAKSTGSFASSTYQNLTTGTTVLTTSSVPTGQRLEIDSKRFKAVLYSATNVPTDVSGTVRRSGGRFWLPLEPGPNVLKFPVDASHPGTIDLVVESAWW